MDGDRDRDPHWNTGLNSLGPNEMQMEMQNVSKEGRIRGKPHPTMDGERDGDPHWNTGLSPQGPNEDQKEGEHDKGCQDRGVCVHPLIDGD